MTSPFAVTTLQLYLFCLVSQKVRLLVPCSSLLTRHPSLGLLLPLVSFNINMQMTHRFRLLSTKLTTLLSCIESWLSALYLWYAQNGLCINPFKLESLLFSTASRLQKIKSTGLTS